MTLPGVLVLVFYGDKAGKKKGRNNNTSSSSSGGGRKDNKFHILQSNVLLCWGG